MSSGGGGGDGAEGAQGLPTVALAPGRRHVACGA